MKQKKVWSATNKNKSLIKFLRLNLIEDYNMNMNSTDIADQLRGVYQPDHWMRNRKWWWAYFIWAIGVAGVNAYKIYAVLHEDKKKSKRPGLPPKWTHAEFLEELVGALTGCRTGAPAELVDQRNYRVWWLLFWGGLVAATLPICSDV